MTLPHPRKRPFAGVRNFRDFGGYPGTGGAIMAPGRFYRSAHHALASDDDLNELAGMKIGAVIDLRRPEERERMPSRRWPGFEGVRLVENHDNDEGAGTESWAGFMAEWDLSAAGVRAYHRRYYERAVTLPRIIDLYTQYFQAVAEVEGPIVVHCAAGKDRTGIICALTHTLAGVHHDDIIADYLLTNDPETFNIHAPIWQAEIKKERGRAPDMDAMHTAMGVEGDYLDRAFAVMKERYGSVESFLTGTLGVTGKRRAAVEAKLFS